MKTALKIIYVILIIILIKLALTFGMNQLFLAKYDKGKYDDTLAKIMLVTNFQQPYIAHYNYGNVAYQNDKFDIAIREYKRALELYPPKKKECSIRINLALAMLEKIEEELEEDETNEEIESEEKKEETIAKLKEARKVLTEENCAGEKDDDGHSKKAEELKADIDEWIERLENGKDDDDDSKKNNNKKDPQSGEDEKTDPEKIKTKEEQLKEYLKKGMEERNDDLSYYRQIIERNNGSYYYDGKNW